MAQPGGVLVRAGHTEAGCDLTRLAGCVPAAVIVEILREDGSMARRPDLEIFAQTHNLKIGTIADLIHYRLHTEKTIERVTECELPTQFGAFHLIAYQDTVDQELHLALVKGTISSKRPTLVRVHMQSALCDLFGTIHQACGWPLHSAMQQIANAGEGGVVVLRNYENARDLAQRVRTLELREVGDPLPQWRLEGETVLRTYGVGAQILMDLGVHKMRVMSAPRSLHGLSGFDLEITEYVEPLLK
jgi:3,4-dihydroxy 2-butanone 4-phosphate synthase/GTP cyclohydrolase II